TDLDAFTDAEAYSLMYSAYRMSAFELERWAKARPKLGELFNPAPVDAAQWCFQPVVGLADAPELPDSTRYMRLLDAGKSLFLKPLLATLTPTAGFWAGMAVGAGGGGGSVVAFVLGGFYNWLDLPVSNWWCFAVIALLPGLLWF